jgi:2-oxoglutarate dehydrogenase complex dehydrogenase (E1) component-like enzyme
MIIILKYRNDSFNNYCNIKFPTTKRFGVEGCDTLISGLGKLTDVI